jgi:carbonic anhydrase/acetyltransferase-like protein (isoleucine patch superfamily)
MIRPHRGKTPAVPKSAYVEPSAQVIGDVVLGEEASVWCNAVLRGDVGPIRVGARTNLQDLVMVHGTREKGTFATLGDDVTVGHSAIIHGATVRDRVLVGMGAIILDGAVIAEDSMVGAGALVTMGSSFPPRSMILGSPARVVRPLRDDEVAWILHAARNYIEYSAEHRASGA